MAPQPSLCPSIFQDLAELHPLETDVAFVSNVVTRAARLPTIGSIFVFASYGASVLESVWTHFSKLDLLCVSSGNLETCTNISLIYCLMTLQQCAWHVLFSARDLSQPTTSQVMFGCRCTYPRRQKPDEDTRRGVRPTPPLSHVPNFSWAWLPSFADDSAGPLAQKHLKTAPRVPAKFPEPCKWPTRCPQSSNMPNMIHTVPGPSPVTLLPMILAGTSHEDFPRNINGNGLPWCSIRCEVALTLPPEFSERNSNKHFFGARPQ